LSRAKSGKKIVAINYQYQKLNFSNTRCDEYI
jgi:hypothetical protein